MRRSWRVISCPQPRRSGCSRFAGRNSGTGVSSRRRIRSGRGWLSGDHEKEAVPSRPAVAGSYETGVLIPVLSMSFPGRVVGWNEAIWDSFFELLGDVSMTGRWGCCRVLPLYRGQPQELRITAAVQSLRRMERRFLDAQRLTDPNRPCGRGGRGGCAC